MRMIKGALCLIQLVCLYHVVKKDRFWLAPVSCLIACVGMSL